MKSLTARFASPFVRSFVFAIALLGVSAIASAGVFVSVNLAPPLLPVYAQPVVPGPGYIWAPGYWAYGPDGYYWVPGTWVIAPYVGALWTPGYWGWGDGGYFWHGGYWGPRVGFYGGINYGFGYGGVGFVGGSWNHGVYNYNTAVTNVNVTNIHNTYNQPIAQNTGMSHVSFNGGTGGITAQPTAEERLAERDVHQAPTQLQAQHQQLASSNRTLLASVNHGTPALAATPRVAAFTAHSTGPVGPGHAPSTGQSQTRSLTAAQSASHTQGQGQNVQRAQQRAVVSHPQVQQQQQQHASQGMPPHPQVQQQQHAVQAAPHPQAHAQQHEEGHH